MPPKSLMLFAAGFGTRMGSLTQTRPKPLIEVEGKPLLEHALDQARGLDLDATVVNTHYLGAQIAAHLSGRNGIAISDETSEILDTGGGLRQALPLLGSGPVFTLNTDAVWTGTPALQQLAAGWDETRMDALLLLAPKTRARGHKGKGDFVISEDGSLSRGPGPIYTGAQIIRTDLLHSFGQPTFSLGLLWDRLIEHGRVFGMEHDGGWCDVGHPGGIAIAEDMLREAENG